MSYNLYKNYDKRHHTPAIILSHIRNFHDLRRPLEGRTKLGSSEYNWGRLKYHFFKQTNQRNLPFHYYLEQVLDDFDVQIALPEFVPSYYLYELARNKIIPDIYKDSILIAIGEDLSFEKAEARMYEQLCLKIIVPLIQRNKKTLQRDKIIYIDEIMNTDTYNLLFEGSVLRYDYKPAIYFNEMTLRRYLIKHGSNISLS